MSSAADERRTRKAQQSEKTRQALLKVARQMFGKNGYAETSLEDVAKRAGVTTGAVYYQFRDKRAVFQAVLEQLQSEVFEGARDKAREMMPCQSTEGYIFAIELVLDSFTDTNYCQIVMIDGPSVLGWTAWHRIWEQRFIFDFKNALEQQMELGRIPREPGGPLAYLLFGSLLEAAMVIAHAEDKRVARREMGAALMRLGSRVRMEQ